MREKEGHALVALMVTDIMGKGSKLYVSGERARRRARVRREHDDDGGVIDLPGVMSRKKQVAPKLLAALSGMTAALFAQQVVDTLGGAKQPDTVLARQMQAISLAVHIPIVCFGIAFPAMFLFVEGLYLRTGNTTYKALAKRWSKVALILFAVGVVTGTILSFEFGLLWPNFMATFGEVFGIAFGLEGISFFVEAIFIAIYVYGWDRLSDRAHFLTGIPIVISGFAGSFNVIAVNGWMNNPEGFDVVNGKVVNPRPWDALINDNMWHELIHMYVAGYIVCGFIVAGVYAYAWLRGRRDHYHRTALVVTLAFASLAAPVQVVDRRLGRPHGGREPAGQARRLRGPAADAGGRAVQRSAASSRSRSCCRSSRSTTRTRPCRGWTIGAARRPPAGDDRARGVPDDDRASAPAWRCSARCSSSPGCASTDCRARAGSTER